MDFIYELLGESEVDEGTDIHFELLNKNEKIDSDINLFFVDKGQHLPEKMLNKLIFTEENKYLNEFLLTAINVVIIPRDIKTSNDLIDLKYHVYVADK
jgi:hypothetical protein